MNHSLLSVQWIFKNCLLRGEKGGVSDKQEGLTFRLDVSDFIGDYIRGEVVSLP